MVSSSRPSSPRKTTASVPRAGEHAGHQRRHPRVGAPRPPAHVGCAGLVSGPRKLNAVATPSSRARHGGVPHRRVEGLGEAERDAGLRRPPRPPAPGVRSRSTPSASSTSADPQDDDAARLPCLTTRRAGAGDDERGHRRDVDRVRPVAAGADDVDGSARAPRSGWRAPSIARPGRASLDRLALGPQRHQEAGDLAGVASPPMIWSIAQRGLVGGRGRCAGEQRGEQVRPGASRPRAGAVSGHGRRRRPSAAAAASATARGEGDRVERVRHGQVGLRPGREPAVLRAAGEHQDRRAVDRSRS